MNIIISPPAEKNLKKIPKIDQLAIAQKIRQIKDDKETKIKKMEGYKDIFRIRIGSYRIVYKKTRTQVYIILIGNRKDVYQILRNIMGR